MEQKKKAAVPLVCHGHSRPVVDLFYSPVTPDGYFLISASTGKPRPLHPLL
jgi:serine-threonine kinase receptor-associated protein